MHDLEDLTAQIGDWNRIHERRSRRSGQHDAPLAHNPAHDCRVAVIGSDERLAAVVEVPDRRPGLSVASKHLGWEVRTFEMLRPLAFETVDAGMDSLQCSDLTVCELRPDRYDEIDVAVLIEIADGEGPLEVGTHEVIAQHRANLVDEDAKDAVEL